MGPFIQPPGPGGTHRHCHVQRRLGIVGASREVGQGLLDLHSPRHQEYEGKIHPVEKRYQFRVGIALPQAKAIICPSED